MSQQPKTETDHLANVLQVLQLGQKTGRLIVERNEGPLFEQGSVTFVRGQIVQASVGQRQSQDALNWLGSWGPCRFSFSAEQGSETTSRLSAVPPHMRTRGEATYGASSSSSLPTPSTGHGYTQRDIFARTTGNLRGGEPLTPTAWLATPTRTRHLEEGMHLIEQMGLSRTHRRLFLLIDGRRTVQQLVRLMSYEPAEVYKLLKDLERAGVVQA